MDAEIRMKCYIGNGTGIIPKRFTCYRGDRVGYTDECMKAYNEYRQVALDVLKSYEDTGYTPEEVAALKADNERLRAERDAAINDILDAAITPCTYCKSNPTNGGNCDCRNEHHDMFSCWQWRGLEESTCGK